jgi:hypothetical protein
MKIEDIRREGFTTSRLAKVEAELTVGNGMLGEVIVGYVSVVSGVTRELSKGCDG